MAGWLADPQPSILDDVEHNERLVLLQSALARMSTECRGLLRAMRGEGQVPIET